MPCVFPSLITIHMKSICKDMEIRQNAIIGAESVAPAVSSLTPCHQESVETAFISQSLPLYEPLPPWYVCQIIAPCSCKINREKRFLENIYRRLTTARLILSIWRCLPSCFFLLNRLSGALPQSSFCARHGCRPLKLLIFCLVSDRVANSARAVACIAR